MHRRIRMAIAAAGLLALALWAPGESVRALPPLPSSFWGAVTANGQNVPDGTGVEASIGGQVYASGYTETRQGESIYALNVPGDDGSTADKDGGREGETVTFRVGGQDAGSATWHGGTNVRVDLSVNTQQELPGPEPTRTQPPTQTPIRGNTLAPTVTPTNVVVRANPTATPTSTPAATSAATATASVTETLTATVTLPATEPLPATMEATLTAHAVELVSSAVAMEEEPENDPGAGLIIGVGAVAAIAIAVGAWRLKGMKG